MKELILYTENNDKVYTYEGENEKWVAIRPICELMGIASQSQLKKIKNNPLLAPTYTQRVEVATDNKSREMHCLPIIFAFAWIGSINAKNAKNPEQVTMIQVQILKALYESIEGPKKYMRDKSLKLEELLTKESELKAEHSTKGEELKGVRNEISSVRNLTFEDWKENNQQLQLEF